MDFLDPEKLRAHRLRLMLGYCLVAIAIVLATVVLIYQANGFGVKQGKVIQNGLVFVQARPGPSSVTLNGQTKATTDARLTVEAGTYTMKLSRPGYHEWQRALTVEGGGVELFTYPLLVPMSLTNTRLSTYQSAPGLVTQSPDRRWLLIQQAGQLASYDVYDTQDPEKAAASRVTVAIPAALLTLPADASRFIEVVEWSNDNDHMLLRHVSGDKTEYIVFSRKTPSTSVNLTKTLQLTPNLVLSLQDKKFDQYFVHDTVANTLSRTNLREPQTQPVLNNVVAFKSYGDDTILYISPVFNQADKVQVRLMQDGRQHVIRNLAASPTYLLALSRYDDAWMIAAGIPAENRVYVYRNPAETLRLDPKLVPASIAVLKVDNPTTVAFSASSQLVMASNATNFAVYDAEYDRSHTFALDAPMDAPQTKAGWIDSHHLGYVSNGKTVIFDYDGTNLRSLAAQIPSTNATGTGLMSAYDTTYVTLYTLSKPITVDPAKPDAVVLSATPLRTPNDQ